MNRTHHEAAETPLVQFVVLSMLLHVLVVVFVGTEERAADGRGDGMSTLDVALARYAPDSGFRLRVAPRVEVGRSDSASTRTSGGTKQSSAAPVRRNSPPAAVKPVAKAAPHPSDSRAAQDADPTVESLPRLDLGAPEIVDKIIEPRREAPTPREAPSETVPRVELEAPRNVEPQVTPAPRELPAPALQFAAPVPRPTNERKIEIAPVAAPETPTPAPAEAPIAAPSRFEPEALPKVELEIKPALQPPAKVEAPPRTEPEIKPALQPTVPVEAPPRAEPDVKPALQPPAPVEAPPVVVPPIDAAPPPRVIPESMPRPELEQPPIVAPPVSPPQRAPIAPRTEREAARPVEAPPAPTLQPAAPRIVAPEAVPRADRVLPSAGDLQSSRPAAAPSRDAPSAEPLPRLKFGAPEDPDDIFKPRTTPPIGVVPPPGQAPRLNLDAAKKAGPEIGRSDGRKGIFNLNPPPTETESKLGRAIQKAAQPDCRDAYAAWGLLAVPFLLKDTITDTGCRW